MACHTFYNTGMFFEFIPHFTRLTSCKMRNEHGKWDISVARMDTRVAALLAYGKANSISVWIPFKPPALIRLIRLTFCACVAEACARTHAHTLVCSCNSELVYHGANMVHLFHGDLRLLRTSLTSLLSPHRPMLNQVILPHMLYQVISPERGWQCSRES